jgi:hypothetical protein
VSPRATGAERVQEQRIRRVAKRRGYTVHKSKRRDPLAIDYGSWQLIHAGTGQTVTIGSIDQVEEALHALNREGRAGGQSADQTDSGR